MDFTCPRCGYQSNKRFCMKQHLERKIQCPPVLQDVRIETIYETHPDFLRKQFNEEKKHVCANCKSKFTSQPGLSRHKSKHCKNKLVPITRLEDKEAFCKLNNEVELLRLKVAALTERKTESFYQKCLEKFKFPGYTHQKVGSCGITDITTDTIHAEIKAFDLWKGAVGQLLTYNLECPKNELHVYLFGNSKSQLQQNEIAERFRALGIKPYHISYITNQLIIKDMTDHSIESFEISSQVIEESKF